ncbi:MAG: caspase, EACC1-associated type [Gemmatimonadales bacterium]
MSRRLALIIGNTQYDDPGLAQLRAPTVDVEGLAELLRDPLIGAFDEVTPLIDKDSQVLHLATARFFAQKTPDDLLLLYFSGHGVRDEDGRLYLAVKDTQRDLLHVTSLSAAFISSEMDRTRSRRQVLILDCCYSGAFAEGSKGGGIGASVDTAHAFEGSGYGRVVLTATDATQYAWEGDKVKGEFEGSVFTHHLAEGLRSGKADLDGDGWVTHNELYDYVFQAVTQPPTRQRPGVWAYKQQGQLRIARSPRVGGRPSVILPGYSLTAEYARLKAHAEGLANWKQWGPYLAERSWGTCREDYSPEGDGWTYFVHDHARSRAYRWCEDGLLGICDDEQYLCFATALWNGVDPILKERLFGLSSREGNHGEDVKECYYYLDSTPTHSYVKVLYRYPQTAFPYELLTRSNRERDRDVPEYELTDTGALLENRYFDITTEYAKAHETDILIRISVSNRSATDAKCFVLPTLWYRNTWSWGYKSGPKGDVPGKPVIGTVPVDDGECRLEAAHPTLGTYTLCGEQPLDVLFTENETNAERLYGTESESPHTKDAFHRYLIGGEARAVNRDSHGTKAALLYGGVIAPGETKIVRLRLSNIPSASPFADFDAIVDERARECSEFYEGLHEPSLGPNAKLVQRQALASLLCSKQWSYYDVEQWLEGDPGQPPPPEQRKDGRNSTWRHVSFSDVVSTPDKWEYPFFSAWNLAFQCVPLSLVDLDFAKRQMELMTNDAYMHPNGQLPAYEWVFGDVNPPVHAWAAWQVYDHERRMFGKADRAFLERVFLRLLLNFTWWVNRRDPEGRYAFEGGFLGLDNIGVFDRSLPLPTGGHVEQHDSVAWLGMYSLNMVTIALELAKDNRAYVNLASRFLQQFLSIAHALDEQGYGGMQYWHEDDGFFYSILRTGWAGEYQHLKVRSMLGLIPLFAVLVLEPAGNDVYLELEERIARFIERRPECRRYLTRQEGDAGSGLRLLAVVQEARLKRILRIMLEESEFLSPYGVRSLSRAHRDTPTVVEFDGNRLVVEYEPGESRTALFGGNTNWRGPIWFPINYLLIDSLIAFHRYFGDGFKVECPTGSGNMLTLNEVARHLRSRLLRLFERDAAGNRPAGGPGGPQQQQLFSHDHIPFPEYFDGDTGAGLGASHFTGWTALVANLLDQRFPDALRTAR